jgi:hypothetical protein
VQLVGKFLEKIIKTHEKSYKNGLLTKSTIENIIKLEDKHYDRDGFGYSGITGNDFLENFYKKGKIL